MAVSLLIGSFLVLLFLGMPISFVLGISSLLFLFAADLSLTIIPQVIFAFVSKFVLLSVPLFIFAAQLMVETSMGPRIIRFANSIVGGMKGGLAQVNIGTSMIFAGVSGAALADVSSIGTVMYRSMVDEGYDPDYAAGLSAASAAVGPIIPPSIPMIVAGSMVEVSVARLFMGGIMPGLMMGVGMGVVAYILAHLKNHPLSPFRGFREIFLSLSASFLDLTMPLVVIGGIVFGFFTPTEASAIAVLYILGIGGLRREINWAKIKACGISAVRTTGEVLFIASMAVMFGWALVYSEVPQHLVQSAIDSGLSIFWLKFIMILLLIFLGTFLSGLEALLVTLPLFIPVVEAMGLDVFHMTLVIVMAAMIGTITPPVGLTLYVISSVSGRTIWAISRAMMPFLLVNVLVVFLTAYIPQIATFIPDAVGN
ncbi:TRAP transporter large permease [Shumkonia mesophila]|uniref:TRAP transporter large permease n=1 Tax=Shumkonia mesophila TaxID=2838854 RepID=UPI002934356B|nr:TRAP transporter large permease [Shumkonia mesophila]